MESCQDESVFYKENIFELNSIYELIFNYSPIGIFCFDKNGNIVLFNEKFTEILGSERNKLINFNIFKNVKDSNILKAIEKCLSNNEVSYYGEYTSVTGNKTVYMRLILKPLLNNKDKTIIGGIGLVEDFTQQHKAEQDLILSKSQILAILDNLPSGAWLKDLDGKYTAVNQRFSEVCRKPFKKIIGYTDKDIWGSELASKIVEEDFKVITNKKKITNRVKFDLFGTEQIWEEFKTPVFGKDGEVVGTCGYFTDIKSNIETETALLNEKKYFEYLFNNSPDAIIITDKNSTVLRVNKKFVSLFQYSEDEVLGRNIDDLIAEGKEIETARNITLMAHSGNLTSYEAVRLKKDRTKIDVNILGVPITMPDGTVVVYGIYQDISKQKAEHKELIEARQKAVESDKIKSNFLANISHELRTPLNGILGFSELLMSEIKDDNHLDMINNIRISGNRLLETIDTIIDVSIIESNKLNLELTEVEIIDFIEKIIQPQSKVAFDKGLKFEFKYDSHIIFKTDRRIFQQIILNLVRNAVKYTNIGKITVGVSKAEVMGNSFLMVSVEDTGIGINKDDFDKIFQHFTQVSEGYSRRYEGTGLGLTITKHYVELLNGYITLESELGKGSIFKVFLPLNEDDIIESFDIFNNKKNKKKSLLLIEDNKANADFIYFCLKDLYDVDVTSKLSVALQLIDEKQFQLIIMDIIDNNIDSDILFLNSIKSKIKKIPVIALSSNKDRSQINYLLNSGFTDYLSKPFRKEDLRKIIFDNISNI